MSFFNTVFKFIRGDEADDDDQNEFISEQESADLNLNQKDQKLNNNNNSAVVFNNKRDSSKIISLNNHINMQVVISYPKVVDDAATACDYIKQNKTCIINLEGIDRIVAQRIADFLGGAAYAINGDIQRISADIFIIAPSNVNITGELKEELKANGLILPWVPSSSFKKSN